MVFKAMNLGKGHWFECPNGHAYVIGDCGGAIEKSKCPECKELIGGKMHQLEKGNKQATFVGKTRPAYDPNDIENNERVARDLQEQFNREFN